MRRCACRYALVGLAIVVLGCGGGSGYTSSPGPSPSPAPTPPPTTAGQVSIVGQRGNTSFSPNPAVTDSSQMLVWNNADTAVHRLVANDNSFDTGNIAPGAASGATIIPAAGANYHCSIHPAMVGAVSSASGQTPPCTGIYC